MMCDVLHIIQMEMGLDRRESMDVIEKLEIETDRESDEVYMYDDID